MIERNISWLKKIFPDASFIFVIERAENIEFSLSNMLKILAGENTKVVERVGETFGAICSCLLAIDILKTDEELIICNSDLIISDDITEYFHRLLSYTPAAGVFTFKSVHPQWSYISSENDEYVTQAFEKKVISNKAIAGLYYFETSEIFIRSAKLAILNQPQIDNKFYITAALNHAILDGEKVVYVDLPDSSVNILYSPEEITRYIQKLKNSRCEDDKTINVVIPAAGMGSRFASKGWKKPKPFIDLDGKPLLEHVISNVQVPNSNITVLLREEHIDTNFSQLIATENNNLRLKSVPKLTEGTAITVLSEHREIDNDNPLLIANSDQLVDFSVEAFVQDSKERDLDGSILVFREPTLDPKWSYAKTDFRGNVTEVAEKLAISEYATVGIYLFRTGRSYVQGCMDMIVANERVNGEFYVCPVYNFLISKGARIGVYEIEKKQMHGLGTPEDFEYYVNHFNLKKSVDQP